MANTEAIAQHPQAEGVWQPKWLGEKGAWICERQTRDTQGRLAIETWGAYLTAPDGTKRFSAGHFPQERHAQGMCAQLNDEAGANG